MLRRLSAHDHRLQPSDLAAQVLFNFELGNQVYAKARVKPTTKANLWLGADVMLEYPLDEATQLLVHGLLLVECRGIAVGDRPLALTTSSTCHAAGAAGNAAQLLWLLLVRGSKAHQSFSSQLCLIWLHLIFAGNKLSCATATAGDQRAQLCDQPGDVQEGPGAH